MNILNRLIVSTLPFVPKPLIRKFAGRYIAGENIPDAILVVKELNSHGILATLDVLGEDIHRKEEALAARDMILHVLDIIQKERLDSNVSVKLTQLGLKLDRNFCLNNMKDILYRAKEHQNFIRIDMEDSTCTDNTLWVYRELRKEFSNVGIVLQAYLRRTMNDAQSLIRDGLKNFRLCKGIYIEPETIAYKSKSEINQNFINILQYMLRENCYVGIATHDSELVNAAYKIISDFGLRMTEYEFQMLLGVRPELRSKILHDGHRLRVYVPFGKHWYQYSIRRLKENPQIAGYVVKALLKKNSSH
jgi:proline dehydrogenase